MIMSAKLNSSNPVLMLCSSCLFDELSSLSQQAIQCEDLLAVHSRQLHLWETLHKPIKDFLGLVSNEEKARIQQLNSLLQLARSNHEETANETISLSQSVQQLHQRVVLDESLSKEWTAVANFNLNLEGVVGKALTFVTRMKDSWQHLLRDRATRGKIISNVLCMLAYSLRLSFAHT